jgi:putative ABC transport system permease protein
LTSIASPAAAPTERPDSGLAVTLTFALRNLRSGVRGFGVFLGCIALGVMAIVGVGSTARSLSDGLASQGRLILGGDVSASLLSREASADELAWIRSRGAVVATATLRSMVRTQDGRSALVEPKAVDAAYPGVGDVVFEPPAKTAELFAQKDGVWGAAADSTLFARLGLQPGDVVLLGDARIALRAELVSEPDKLAAGINFGPRLMLSQDGLRATGLLQPGSLVRWTYRVSLPRGEDDDAALTRFADDLQKRFPESGFEVRSRANAAPQFQRNIERFTQFLTIVGLTALVVGGVGVANAVSAYVDRRRATLATLKALGATGGRVFTIALVEVLALAILGILIGLVAGAALPFLINATAGALLPVPLDPHVYGRELALGVLYGVLTALAFSLWPLGRTHDVPVSALFRDQVEPGLSRPRRRYVLSMAAAVLALAASAILLSYDKRIAIAAVLGTAVAFVMLRLVAAGIMAIAARVPRPARTELRLAIGNIHRPGALTPSLVLSLGLGVTLLVTLAVIDQTIRAQLTRSLPDTAPSFFFLDVPATESDRFDAFLAKEAQGARTERVPMMRGRVIALKGVPVAEVKAAENAAWVLEGDRGITYSATPPQGSKVSEGQWWPADYRGPPLVSFDKELARGLDLSVGDEITVNVLGRNLTAKVANLRTVEWQKLGINFVMVFSPSTFAGAPHTDLATITFPNGSDNAREAAILAAAAQQFPNVTSVRVKDALEAVNDVVGKLAMAIQGASAISVLASVLVLAGALAAGHRARVYDAVVLKTLGATRRRLLLAFVLEYGLLGLATAIFGAMAGAGAAWWILTSVMKLDFDWQLSGAIAAAASAVVVTIGLGLLGTWRILGQKPAAYLRNM